MKKIATQNFTAKIFFFISCFAQLQINASTPMLLRLDVVGNSMQNETVVYFDASGSFNYNPSNDAPSLGTNPGYLNIVTRFDSIDYQIKCLPLLTQNISIPVKVTTGSNGTYQIYGNDIQNLPMGACISLYDNFTNTSQDLRSGSYTCTISDTESVARFVLNISITVISVSGNFMDPTCSLSGNGYVSVNPPSSAVLWNYYWKDSLNNIIKTSLQKNIPDTLFGMNAGAYSVDITSTGSCSNGTINFYLQGTQTPIALFISSADTLTFSSPVFFTNNSINATTYIWDFGDGMGTTDANPSHYYVSDGTYTVTLTAINDACGDTSFYYNEITVIYETTTVKQIVDENKNMFIGKDANGYYVKFSGTVNQDAVITVTDILGQKITDDREVKNMTNEKIYIDIANSGSKILIISAISSSGEKTYKKIIN